jgi:hypothetical protein
LISPKSEFPHIERPKGLKFALNPLEIYKPDGEYRLTHP